MSARAVVTGAAPPSGTTPRKIDPVRASTRDRITRGVIAVVAAAFAVSMTDQIVLAIGLGICVFVLAAQAVTGRCLGVRLRACPAGGSCAIDGRRTPALGTQEVDRS